MRLGGPLFKSYDSPEQWANVVKGYGYRAAYCPVEADASQEVIDQYACIAQKEDIVIAEVGAWSNPISPDENESKKAVGHCIRQLELADRIGARCCVNIAGSRSNMWCGPHPDNFSKDTFDLIVETVRKIIDAVKPQRTFYTLEMMEWIFPDSPDTYLDLIKAVDRERFAVHLDPVNMIASPRLYFNNSALIRETFKKLGPYIKSCHAKDIFLSDKLTVHLDEVRPGLGFLDYHAYLEELNKLDPDIPLMLEHLNKEEEYIEAAQYIRSVEAQL